ncbi:MAG: hypothetical protein ACRC4M_04360, partial [Mycoplasma sp.]
KDVIKHPNWSMGDKISHDSATLINKCFEIIEAFHLFETKNITALYHPQSIIHGMVEFTDNSVFANLSKPDMKLAIELAINNFNKAKQPSIERMNFNNLNLTLNEIDTNKWKPIKWAYDVINDKNNSLGLIITVANELAIESFKKDEIKFSEFYNFIEKYIDKYKKRVVSTLSDIEILINEINSSKF